MCLSTAGSMSHVQYTSATESIIFYTLLCVICTVCHQSTHQYFLSTKLINAFNTYKTYYVAPDTWKSSGIWLNIFCGKITEGQNLGALEPKWLVPVVELKSNLTKKINRRLHDGNGAASKIAQNRGRLVWDQRSNSNSILERFTSITYTGPTTTPSNSYF